MNSNEIQQGLICFARANTSDIVVPNYYIGRYECDLLKITKVGHLYEYEIKVSRADFKKDAEKAYRSYRTGETVTKHTEILNGKRCHRFYFVVPEGLVNPAEVPDGFGLIYACVNKYLSFKIVKISKLFKAKNCDDDMYRHIACNLTFKLETAKRRAHGAEAAYRKLLKEKKQ